MPDSVFRFHIGLRKGSKSFEEARAAGFQISSINHDYQSNSYIALPTSEQRSSEQCYTSILERTAYSGQCIINPVAEF
jgi:ketol-acid reductoisomerase